MIWSRAEEVLNQIANEIGAGKVTSDSKIAKVSVVGVGMRSHAGVASQMFAALGEVGINILMITTSEIKISVIVEEKFLELAVRALHSSFGLEKDPKDENAAPRRIGAVLCTAKYVISRDITFIRIALLQLIRLTRDSYRRWGKRIRKVAHVC